jgi:UDP-glucose 4-epimerase
MKSVLVTGGAGFIGAHVVKALRDGTEYNIHVIDNFSQTTKNIIKHHRITYHEVDICDETACDEVFRSTSPDAVLHFAAIANVPDSVSGPIPYYQTNVVGSLNILNLMQKYDVKKMIFSSSASIYGEPETEEIDESHPKEPTNPYGRTKLIVEQILSDYYRAYGIDSVSLRYFCAAGADPDGELGEYHIPETHAIPSLIEAHLGLRDEFSVFGDDFPTPDGTGVRDYIHVTDLANAHLCALQKVIKEECCVQYNLGINKGFSVLELIQALERITGEKISYTTRARRPGDPARLIAKSNKAQSELGWKPKYVEIDSIVSSAFKARKNK